MSLNFALGRVQATTVGVALLLEAPVAALLAWLWLDQMPAGPAWAGLGLVMAGVSVVVISDARSMKTASGVLDDGGRSMLISLPVITLDETAMNEMHALVWDTAHSGRHDEAARIARTLESSAVRAHGVRSPQATRWIEVQAVLARPEGAPHRACGLWLTAVQHRAHTERRGHGTPGVCGPCLPRVEPGGGHQCALRPGALPAAAPRPGARSPPGDG